MSAAAQTFDPFLPKPIPFHVRGDVVTDIGSVVHVDYVTQALNGFQAMEEAQTNGLCRVVVSPVKLVAS